MTTITIKNLNNFSLSTLEKILNSLDIEVIKIESDDNSDDIPSEHLTSIQRGLDQLQQGLGISNSEVHEKARKICLK